MKFRFLLATAALAVVIQQAAGASYAFAEGAVEYTYATLPGVTVTDEQSYNYDYYGTIIALAAGAYPTSDAVSVMGGSSSSELFLPSSGDSNSAWITFGGQTSASASSWGYGEAFIGYSDVITFTNTTDRTEEFSMQFQGSESHSSGSSYSDYAEAEGFGGFQEYGGSFDYGYFDAYSSTTYGDLGTTEWGSFGPTLHGSFSDAIGAGQTVAVQLWAGSDVQAFANDVPSPAAAIPMVVGLIGLARRKRGK